MECARHPGVETLLTCVTCGTPICPDCMVETPVGMKCPDCGHLPLPAVYRISAGRLALAMGTAAAIGTLAGVLALVVRVGFLLLLLAVGFAAGALAAEAASRASGGKRGRVLAIAAAASVVVGALLVAPQLFAVFYGGTMLPWRDVAVLLARRPMFLVFGLLAAGTTFWRVR
jgi:predicted RNA-binding Zn-ribbon protein involved in translation (DUF1610 family)